MFKLFIVAAVLAIAAAEPGLVGAPLAYSAPAVAYSSAYSAPLVKAAVAAPVAYSAGYASPYSYPYAYSAGYVSSPYVSYVH